MLLLPQGISIEAATVKQGMHNTSAIQFNLEVIKA